MWKAAPPTMAARATTRTRQPQHPVATQKSGPFPFLGGGGVAASGSEGSAGGREAGRAGAGAGGRDGALTRGGMDPGGSEPVGGTAAGGRTGRGGGGGGGGGGAAGRGGGLGAVWTTVASGVSVSRVAPASSPSISTRKPRCRSEAPGRSAASSP